MGELMALHRNITQAYWSQLIDTVLMAVPVEMPRRNVS